MTQRTDHKASPDERLIAAGRTLFFKHGFAGVTTDDLVRAAGTSKATLYKYFSGPSGLLAVIVRAEARRFENHEHSAPTTRQALENSLKTYGSALLSFLNDPEIIQFSRTMHEGARAHPEVAEQFFQSAYGKARETLAAMFTSALDAEALQSDLSAPELADMLLGMMESTGLVKASLGATDHPFPDPEGWAHKCVDQLLAGCC